MSPAKLAILTHYRFTIALTRMTLARLSRPLDVRGFYERLIREQWEYARVIAEKLDTDAPLLPNSIDPDGVGVEEVIFGVLEQWVNRLRRESPPKSVALRPGEFDFGGHIVGGFSMPQLELLSAVWNSGPEGILTTDLMIQLGYQTNEAGKKAFDALKRRAADTLESNIPYILDTINSRLVFTKAHDSQRYAKPTGA